jgi:hypothetical protein
MTRSLSHRITAISMALLMMLSSTGFSMDIHYCQDQLKSVSLLGKAKSCHEKQETPPCHKMKKSCHHKEDNVSKADKDNCCHNETVVIEKSDLDATPTQLSTVQDIQLDFVAAFVAVYVFNYSVQADFQPYAQYKPPLPDRDVQVLYQTFLI